MRDLKYLFACTIPVSAYLSFMSFGAGTYAAAIYAFVIIPFLDAFLGQDHKNLEQEEIKEKKINRVFDWMLYINLPIVFGLLFLVFSRVQSIEYTTTEMIGLSLSTGILLVFSQIRSRSCIWSRNAITNNYRPYQ